MAGNIKGITIEFRGDTTNLDKALRKINDETRKLDRELRNVDKALKFNPTNVELWKQKQTLLNQKLKETDEKAKLLRDTLKKVDSGEIEMSAQDADKLKRELIETESKAKHLKGELQKIGNANLKAASEQFKKWGSDLESAGRAMQGISVAAAAVAASMGALAVKSGKWADDLNTMSKRYSIGTGDLQKYAAAADLVDVSVEAIAKSQTKLKKNMLGALDGTNEQAQYFEQLGVNITNTDGSLRDANDVFDEVIQALGEMENETERDAIAMALMGKSAGELNPLIEDNGETYKRVSETFSKYGLDYIDQDTLDKANEFNDQLDTIKAIGLVAFQEIGTQLAAYLAPALEKVVDWVGKLAEWLTSLSPETLALVGIIASVVAAIAPLLIVLGKLATGIGSIMNLANMMGTTIGALAGPIGIAIAAIAAIIAIGVLLYKNWDKIQAKAKKLWTNIKTIFAGIKKSITDAWNNAKKAVQQAIAKIVSTAVAKFRSLKTTLTTVVTTIKTNISTAWENIKTAISDAITKIKTNVSDKFTAVKTKVVDTFTAIKTKVTTIWNGIKDAITKPIETAKNTISTAIAKIKSIINGAKLSLPKFKLPHFKINGGELPWGIGGKGYPPSISVQWYKEGGIFDRPSLVGLAEAGAEAVVPLDKLWNKLDRIADGSGGIVININGANSDPKEIAQEVKRVLIQESNRRRLAWQ